MTDFPQRTSSWLLIFCLLAEAELPDNYH